jgi:hypothetical protein
MLNMAQALAGVTLKSDECDIQRVAGNKKGDFAVEAQFLSKLHTNNG